MTSTRFVFFRLDDVGLPGDAYFYSARRMNEAELEEGRARAEHLLDVFRRRGEKAILAVVPWHCTTGDWEWLSQLVRDEQFELAQHGYRHMEYGCHEFGRHRSYEEQARDIAEGAAILKETFGLRPEIFVPPSNTYDVRTLQALANHGFRILSAGTSRSLVEHIFTAAGRGLGVRRVRNYPISWHEKERYGLIELSVSVDACVDYASNRIKPPRRLIRDVSRALRRHRVVGIMLHPWQQTETQAEVLGELLHWLEERGLRSALLSEIVRDISSVQARN